MVDRQRVNIDVGILDEVRWTRCSVNQVSAETERGRFLIDGTDRSDRVGVWPLLNCVEPP